MGNATLTGAGWLVDEIDRQLVQYDAETQSLVDGAGNLFLPSPHPKYHFMGSARAQTADEAVFRDLVSTNNGTFGAHLSVANAWADIANGYVATVDPAGGTSDSCIKIPAPSFDMQNGEAMLIFWSGVVTPEGADVGFMGTSISAGASGLRIQAKANGSVAVTLYDGAGQSSFGPSSMGAFAAGTLTNFAVWLDGQGEWIAQWANGSITHSQAIVKRNTLSADVFSVGKASPSAVSTDGIASKMLALHMLKWGASDAKPSIAKLSAAVAALNRNPIAAIAAGVL